jgi:hypothetical protein
MADKSSCLTHQIYTEPCPQCGCKDQVYIGHGIVRYCDHCVISWDVSEVMDIQFQALKKAFRADTPPVVDAAQERVILDIQATARELNKAAAMDERLNKLLDISDEEWQNAEFSE